MMQHRTKYERRKRARLLALRVIMTRLELNRGHVEYFLKRGNNRCGYSQPSLPKIEMRVVEW